MKNRSGTDEILRCSFCHKSQDAVAKLISSPSDYPRAYICDECVAVCNSILEDDRTATPPSSTPNQLLSKHSGQKLDKVEKDVERDFIMNAQQAKEYGIIDEIIYKTR